MRKFVLTIMGPTASGKTALACALADALPVKLISVDSALVYRGMDIGSAKPTAAELEQYPHALIDIYEPHEVFSAGEFVEKVTTEIEQAFAENKIPLLVGGSMMYFRRLQYGVADLPAADPATRAQIEERAETEGWNALHAELADVDPAAAQRIHPNDAQRISRALEIYYLTGKPITQLQQESTKPAEYDFLNIVLLPDDRAWLHKRIKQRVDMMLDGGFVAEMRNLFADERTHSKLPAMKAVGYAEFWKYCAGEWDLATAREKAIVATRRLAKHQITWLRNWDNINVFAAENDNAAAVINLVKEYGELN